MKKIAITGTNSFSGLWVANSLSENYQVSGFTTSEVKSYSGLKRVRLEKLKTSVKVYENIRAEDQGFNTWVKQHGADVWIHHHHYMENFRLQSYNMEQAEKVGLNPLEQLVQNLAFSNCKGIIYSSSYFEAGEGGKSPEAPVLPYARTKTKVFLSLEALCKKYGLKLARVVLPNPFGPLENSDRLIPNLIKKSLKGEILQLTTPNSVADNLPKEALVKTYLNAINWIHQSHQQVTTFRPSGWVCNNLEFVQKILTDLIQRRLDIKPCLIEVSANAANPTSLRNPPQEQVAFDLEDSLNDYARILAEVGLEKALS